MDCDTVVAGGGMAGLTAALACAQAGLRVHVLEKRNSVGGQAAVSAGAIWAPPTYQDIRDYVPDGDPALQRMLVDNLPDDMVWLKDSGLPLSGVESLAGFGLGRVMQGGESGQHGAFMSMLADCVTRAGGRVEVGVAMTSATRQANAAWSVRLGDGRELLSRAIVLATGGFQGSKPLLEKYLGKACAAAVTLRGLPESTGDGLAVALSAGAATSANMSSFYGHSMPDCHLPPASLQPLTPYFARYGVLVNREGARFVDEGAALLEEVNPQEGCRQPGGKYYLLFDRRIYEQHGINQNVISAVPSIDRLAKLMDLGAPIYAAATLDELADRLALEGVGASRLLETVRSYNAACSSGRGVGLSPPRVRNALPLVEAPFYAMRCVPGITNTCGGIRIDQDTCVLTASGERIDGLYAAGVDAGGVFGRHYAGFLGWAVSSGRRAGMSATRGIRR